MQAEGKKTYGWKYDYNIMRSIYENLLINPKYKLLQVKSAPQVFEYIKVELGA